MAFCSNCGSNMGEDARFCTNCGRAMGQASAAADPAWAKVLAAARQEGRIFLYSSVPTPITAKVKEDFEKAKQARSAENSSDEG